MLDVGDVSEATPAQNAEPARALAKGCNKRAHRVNCTTFFWGRAALLGR
jgi:hypothetical protein